MSIYLNQFNSRVITSWDDGGAEDVGLSQMLNEYHIPGIFFIPNNCKIPIETIRYLDSSGFELGVHTFSHPEDMKALSLEKQVMELAYNKGWLEGIIGKKITNLCYPSGRFDERTIEAAKMCGIKSARTVNVLNIEIPNDPFKISTTVHVYPHRKEYGGRKWYEVAIELYRESLKKENGYFHLWGHSWEVEKFGLWEELEDFFKAISKDQKLWTRETT